MPVQLPANAFRITNSEIRMFLRDQPQYNILLDTIEFTDDDINLATKLTLAKYNAMLPQTTVPTAALLNEYILLMGVCAILLRSEGIRQLRNQLVTQDGNIAMAGIDEKQALYAEWAERFNLEFTKMAQDIKMQNNMESCYGGFGSGYRYIGRWTN
jgi:hypothetical protein